MDKNEFTATVQRNEQRLFLIALSFTKNRADAEDILQNVFLKLWEYKKTFTDALHTDKWLTTVCVNESRNYIRSPFRSRVSALDDADELCTFDDPKNGAVFRAVMSLPQKDRTALHLFYYEDMSVGEIAKQLHTSPAAVKTRLCRAREKLKNILGDEDNR
ncbi:MAG: sigma-70 family RNA polymerase sigma factor [Clostridia bacterium]|nr:sigma-70 family RNA polymerase sigma factor [Clostridia bacterium]MBR5427809.1 sigma-70 family RNA polymerase sigma factor [Clostridia bacterium]